MSTMYHDTSGRRLLKHPDAFSPFELGLGGIDLSNIWGTAEDKRIRLHLGGSRTFNGNDLSRLADTVSCQTTEIEIHGCETDYGCGCTGLSIEAPIGDEAIGRLFLTEQETARRNHTSRESLITKSCGGDNRQ